jgi:hypothetical protein
VFKNGSAPVHPTCDGICPIRIEGDSGTLNLTDEHSASGLTFVEAVACPGGQLKVQQYYTCKRTSNRRLPNMALWDVLQFASLVSLNLCIWSRDVL